MRLIRNLAAVAALALVLGLVSPTRADNPPATKLAVVNIISVFQGLDARKAGDDELDVMAKKLEDERHAKEDALKAKDKELGEYNPTSTFFREQQEAVFKMAMDLDAFSRYIEQKLLMERRLRTLALYKSMNEAISAYAKAQGIALVLVVEDPKLSEARTPQDLQSKIIVHKVMYADPALDITSAIIEKMNSEAKHH